MFYFLTFKGRILGITSLVIPPAEKLTTRGMRRVLPWGGSLAVLGRGGWGVDPYKMECVVVSTSLVISRGVDVPPYTPFCTPLLTT